MTVKMIMMIVDDGSVFISNSPKIGHFSSNVGPIKNQMTAASRLFVRKVSCCLEIITEFLFALISKT